MQSSAESYLAIPSKMQGRLQKKANYSNIHTHTHTHISNFFAVT